MIKFSFLVALYNGEHFLPQLFDSLTNQDISPEEFEIICLDDCSPDKSSDVVKKYQAHYPNIRLYKNEHNCRIATNVNKLTQWARGKYIWILGQDDFIEKNCLRMLWNKLESESLDVLVFNYRRVTENADKIQDFYEVENTTNMTGIEWINNQYVHKERDYCYYILGYEWRAIFRTEHWRKNKIRCVDGLSWEDTVIMMKAIVYSKSVASIENILYNYRENRTSISYSSNHLKKGNYIFEFSFLVGDEVEKFYDELNQIAPDLAVTLKKQVYWRYNCFAFDLIRTNREQKRVFYDTYKKHLPLIKEKWHHFNWKSKMILSFVGYPISCICECIYRLKKLILK
ncbi:MAG: glycosyltransferase [Bacteroidaceae bacterium]|nr:glycosyltransferase [Bacteroidaceae bacterium]